MSKVPLVSFAILLVVVLLAALFFTSNKKAQIVNSERFYVGDVMSAGVPTAPQSASVATNAPASPQNAASGLGNLSPSDPLGNEVFNPVTGGAPAPAASCFPRDRLTANDLLPKDAANSTWAQMNPAGQGDVKDQNFLTAGYHIGINTVGQTLRNANLQLRSEPPNPQLPVSPWNISTIEFDNNRRPLEIGSSA